MIFLDGVNPYFGAWVTAGVAVGGVLFSAIQSVASAIAKYNIEKMKNNTAIEVERQKVKQQERTIKQTEIKEIQAAFNDYYVQTSIAIYQKQKSNAQILAYGKLLNYVSEIGWNSKIATIQDAITRQSFTYADSEFQKYLPTLRKEEKQLLSRLGLQQPTEHTNDSEGPQAEPGKKH